METLSRQDFPNLVFDVERIGCLQETGGRRGIIRLSIAVLGQSNPGGMAASPIVDYSRTHAERCLGGIVIEQATSQLFIALI